MRMGLRIRIVLILVDRLAHIVLPLIDLLTLLPASDDRHSLRDQSQPGD